MTTERQPETITVMVTVRVTTLRTVEVEVPVEQTGDIDPSQRDWPDVPDLYDRAKQLVREGEGLLRVESITADGWNIAPSAEGEPWRPLMFGGRIG